MQVFVHVSQTVSKEKRNEIIEVIEGAIWQCFEVSVAFPDCVQTLAAERRIAGVQSK